ncbi:hypothetical protein HYX16_01955 [Candidatus Woesearchaeota archaeon]|nr:hypothetical protein [Candidatus Woesearchaeota archaeon]
MKFYGRSPVRISLCNGGDTDYHIKDMGWSNLINATLSSGWYYSFLEEKKQDSINFFYENRFSKTKNFHKIYDLDKTDNKSIELVRETIRQVNQNFKGDIKIITNVPEKSGLGGSSSFVVSLIKALIKTTKQKNVTPEKIARLGYFIEREKLGIKGGYQDQWAASFGGGVNYLEFKKDNVFLEPLWLSERLMQKLENNLVLFFIEPRKGDSGNIHKELEEKLKKDNKKESLNIMLQRRENVLKTREALLRGNMKQFALLLNYEQESKEKLLSNFLTPKTQSLHYEALSYGASAGKISGAGSGGCAFYIYEKNDKSNFIKKMSSLGCINIPLRLERLNKMGEI